MTASATERQLATEGFARGANDAACLFNGGMNEEAAARFLQGLQDGDPEAIDAVPCSPLSGEWADGLTEDDVLAGIDADPDEREELLAAFEDGYSAGAMYEAETLAAFYADKLSSSQQNEMTRGDASRIEDAALNHADFYYATA